MGEVIIPKYVIHKPGESYDSDAPVWWSEILGWTTLINADFYDDSPPNQAEEEVLEIGFSLIENVEG